MRGAVDGLKRVHLELGGKAPAVVFEDAPLADMLLFVNLVLGVISRVAPQINVFAVGFPITLSVGLLGMTSFNRAPANGESFILRARLKTFLRSCSQTAWTAEPTVAAVNEPPSTGAFGSVESPS